MTTDKGRRQFISVGMFLLPLVLVQVISLVLGGIGPSHASAGPRPAAGSLAGLEPIAAERPPTPPHQQAAARRATALASEPFGPSPLYYTPRPPKPEPTEMDPEVQPAPEFTVQAILAASSGNTALIGGRLHRVGDEIGESGWYITAIDAQNRSVTIEHSATDRTETRQVPRPG
jgi:hypothetical protein